MERFTATVSGYRVRRWQIRLHERNRCGGQVVIMANSCDARTVRFTPLLAAETSQVQVRCGRLYWIQGRSLCRFVSSLGADLLNLRGLLFELACERLYFLLLLRNGSLELVPQLPLFDAP